MNECAHVQTHTKERKKKMRREKNRRERNCGERSKGEGERREEKWREKREERRKRGREAETGTGSGQWRNNVCSCSSFIFAVSHTQPHYLEANNHIKSQRKTTFC